MGHIADIKKNRKTTEFSMLNQEKAIKKNLNYSKVLYSNFLYKTY